MLEHHSPAMGTPDLVNSATRCLELGAQYAYHLMKPDGHWITELRSNISFTAQYVFLREVIRSSLRKHEDGAKVRNWILSQQNQHDGSWSIATFYPGDVSTTVDGYFALKLLGVSIDSKPMRSAREFILSRGGLPEVGVLTQFSLAVFGLIEWDEMAQVPAELMLLPTWCPINIYAFSYWSRATSITLMILKHYQPRYPLPEGASPRPVGGEPGYLDELYVDATDRRLKFVPSLRGLWTKGEYGRFLATAADKSLGLLEPVLKRLPTRTYSLHQCTSYMLERLNEGGYAAFWPSNFNGILAFNAMGLRFDHPVIKHMLRSVDTYYLWEDESGIRNQVTCGPVWDTALMSLGLCDAGLGDARLDKTVEWFKAHQVLEVQGDYRARAPNLAPGGWAFQYNNDWYPDTDDTLTALLAILHWKPSELASPNTIRGIEWLLGLQCSNGGWGCYDIDNDNKFLNLFPFGQGNEFFDAPVPDVSARIIEALGYILSQPASGKVLPLSLTTRIRLACDRGIEYLAATQDKDRGTWWARWHVNYINGTGSALVALSYFRDSELGSDQCVIRGIDISRSISWFKSAQNADGGWGESLATYKDPSQAGYGESTPTQTSWALMALLPYLDTSDGAIVRGIQYLTRTQVTAPGGATWDQEAYASVGFPNIVWLDYTSSRHAYPMMAMGRYIQKARVCSC